MSALRQHSREEIRTAIEKWIELNNFIVIINWDALLPQDYVPKARNRLIDVDECQIEYSYPEDNPMIKISVESFYAVGLGSITEHVVIALFQERLPLEIVRDAAIHFLKIFSSKYSHLPTYDPKECDDYIDSSAEEYVKNEAEFELSVCQDNRKYLCQTSERVNSLKSWIDYFKWMSSWLTNVEYFINQ